MSSAPATAEHPTIRQRLWVLACLTFIAAPHVLHMPLWVTGLVVLLLLWQALAAWRRMQPPHALIRILMAITLFVIVYAGFGRIDGRDAGVALLLFMLPLKLSETYRHRDLMVLLSLTYFLLITQLLFSQSLGMAAYLVLGCWLITATIFYINSGGKGRPLVDSARLLLQALPIAAVMFVLFPRLPGSLWGMPSDTGATAVTGLSDTMAPGSISQLAMSDAVVLRAAFPDGLPPPGQRYWRGPVLWHFENGVWSAGRVSRKLPAPTIKIDPGAIRTVHIMPVSSDGKWIIGLDFPLGASVPVRTTAGGTLITKKPDQAYQRYTVRSATHYILAPDLPPVIRRYATQLPPHGNPRARALAAHWQTQGQSPRDIVNQALAWFRKRPFVYTLTPPAIADRKNQIDAFLFDTQSGFCAHYAGAFAFLMRAAGVPARVVTGYLGGEPSALGNYWLVRSANAHAWVEVWLQHAGWVRVDPTAAVDPARIESGIAAALENDSNLPYMVRASGQFWYHMRMFWDGINTAWTRWFLAYGTQLQKQFLKGFGLSGLRDMLMTLTGLIVALLGIISFWLAWQSRPESSRDPVERGWRRINKRLAKRGYPRDPHEGPQAYCQRVARQRPDWRAALAQLESLYIDIRYAGHDTSATRRRFVRASRRFKPR